MTSLLSFILALTTAPLIPGIINRIKAVSAGRQGPPLLQNYYDLAKLMKKGVVYSHTTTWLFKASPVIQCAAACAALLIVPFGGGAALLHFKGDLLLFAYLLAMGRFFLVLGALDTGSSFEGMGASREVLISALTEPAFLLGFTALASFTGRFSLTGICHSVSFLSLFESAGTATLLIVVAMMLVFLTENARIPVDDPNTHLELTMVHEVMVLDHSGPDLALIEYTAALKLWIYGALLIGIVNPAGRHTLAMGLLIGLAGMAVIAILTGFIESIMARLPWVRVPQLIASALVLSILASIIVGW